MIPMNLKMILALFGVMLFGAGIVMAIAGATPTQIGDQYRWSGNASSSLTTEGGNITAANVGGVALTDRWAAFFGNISSTIVLGNNSNYVYQWSYSTTTGGEVCLSTNSSYPFAGIRSATVATVPLLNSAFTHGVASDNATNTFTTTATCNLQFDGGVAASNTANVATQGGFNTCMIQNNNATKSNFAFCTAINSSGTNYLTNQANYQVMVPTTPGSGTATYFFYMVLN